MSLCVTAVNEKSLSKAFTLKSLYYVLIFWGGGGFSLPQCMHKVHKVEKELLSAKEALFLISLKMPFAKGLASCWFGTPQTNNNEVLCARSFLTNQLTVRADWAFRERAPKEIL